MPQYTVPRVIYRYVSGRPIDGTPRTDATYFRRATKALTTTGRTTRWSRMPGYQRQAYRLTAPAVITAHHFQPQYTVTALVTIAALGTVYGARKGRQAWRARRFNRAYTTPTLTALRQALGNADIDLRIDPALGSLTARLAKPMSQGERELRALYAARVEPIVRYLPDRVMRVRWALQRRARPITAHLDRWRRPVEDHGPSITVSVNAPWLTQEQRQHVCAIIAGKIPVSDLVERFDAVGPTVTARWTVRKRPPSFVGKADFEARAPQLPEHQFFIGLGVGGRPVVIDLKADSPHIGVSAASGAGKSELAKDIAVQVLMRGGQVVILDIKGSHRWAYGLPGVTYCTAEEEIHNAWVRLGALAKRRNAEAFKQDADWDPGQRIFVIAEEANGMIDALADHWADVRESSKDRDPAVRGIRDILRMGRSAKVNIMLIAQRLSAAATSGGDARENLAVLALARFSPNTWRMLCDGIAMPRVSKTLGRWHIISGGTVEECQVAYLDPWDARTMVLKHAGDVSGVRQATLIGDDQGLSAAAAPQPDMPADPLGELVTLKEAADRAILPWGAEAARKRFKRAQKAGSKTLPEAVGKRGQGDLYTVGSLIEWAEAERVS
jgi:hypothetical protein